MRTLFFILSAAAILFLMSCEEDPTSSNFSNGLRIIKLYNLNSNSVSNIEEVKNVVYDCEYKDSSNFGYSTYYHAIGELIVRDLRTYNSYNGYFSSFIFCFRLYPELESIFTDGIFWIKNFGEIVSNLASGFSPVLIANSNELTYGDFNNLSEGMIISYNLETEVIDTLIKVGGSYLTPIFITEDEAYLIYTEQDLNTGGVSIKSLNRFDLQDIKTLTSSIPISKLGKNRSVDDKIALTSKGTVYVLDLNTGDILNVATSGQFADISNDGQMVVFTTGSEMYLINSDGTNQQKLISKVEESKYVFLPSFSSDDQQIVFVESDYYYGYYQK
jgi:hypothetical protein